MDVITVVAADTRSRYRDTATHLFFVASVAIQFLVSAIQLEFGALVVIEIPCLP